MICISDIYKSDPIAAFHPVADDGALFCANKNINQLKNNIDTSLYNIANWLKGNKLTLNVDKSKLFILTCHQHVKEMYLMYVLLENHWNLIAKQNTLG